VLAAAVRDLAPCNAERGEGQKSEVRGRKARKGWRGIAQRGAAYYASGMTTISLKLPESLLARLEKESRARRTTKSSVVRECLEQQLPAEPLPMDLPVVPPGESFYDKALPILKRAWARNRRLPRDLATNPKYMKGFGE
jgi:hypothetical protein